MVYSAKQSRNPAEFTAKIQILAMYENDILNYCQILLHFLH